MNTNKIIDKVLDKVASDWADAIDHALNYLALIVDGENPSQAAYLRAIARPVAA